MFKKVAGVLVAVSPMSVFAAIDPAVATGVTALQADAATLAGIVTAAVVAIMLIKLGIRLLKSLLSRAV